jgi:hypothetical protein
MPTSSSSFIFFSHCIFLQLPLKLNHDNYLSGKFFILPHARGHDLLGFLDGFILPPPSTVMCIDGSSTSNPAYTIWLRQDQLLLI